MLRYTTYTNNNSACPILLFALTREHINFGAVWAYHCRGIAAQAKHKYYRKNALKSPLKGRLGIKLMETDLSQFTSL